MLAFVFLCAFAATLNNVKAFKQPPQTNGQSMGLAYSQPMGPSPNQPPMMQPSRMPNQSPMMQPFRMPSQPPMMQPFRMPMSMPMSGPMSGPMLGSMLGPMSGSRSRRRSRNSFKRTPSYLGAKSLGCVYGVDSESLVGMMLPRGCTAQMDFCPFKYPGRQCRRVGTVGMCCPFYVTLRTISASAGVAQMRAMMEMLS